MITLSEASERIVKDCMGLKPDERFLIIYDGNKEEIAKGILNQALNISKSSEGLKIPVGKVNGEEPPTNAAEKMKECDVLVLTTTVSASHTKARRDATDKGVRIASMPGITKDMMERTLNLRTASLRFL